MTLSVLLPTRSLLQPSSSARFSAHGSPKVQTSWYTPGLLTCLLAKIAGSLAIVYLAISGRDAGLLL